MNDIIGAEATQPPSGKLPPPVLKRVAQQVRKIAAILIWLYLITKIFVFDIDNFVIQKYAPSFQWVLDYKFFLLIGLLGASALLFRKWQLLIFIGYVIFYPLLLIFWVVPYAIFKSRSWIIAIAVINSVIRFFANFKLNAIMAGLFLLSALGISIAHAKYAVIGSTAGMGVFVVVLYVFAVLAVFRPDAAFRVYSKVFAAIRNHTVKTYALGEELAAVPIENFTEQQLEKRQTNLQFTVMSNRLYLFAASKLKAYGSSKLSLIAGVFKCFWLVAICVIAFAFINYGVYQLDPAQFSPSVPPTPFLLLYYSFKTFISNSVNDLVPVKQWAELVSMAENLFGFFTVSIFVTTLFTQKNARQTKEIDNAVKSIQLDAEAMEGFVRSEFRLMTIEDAIAELERVKASLLGVVLWLSQSRSE